MSICLLVMTDGREHVTDAIRSAEANLTGPITHRIIHDDSGDDDHRAWLHRTFPGYLVVYRQKRLGFSGAYANAWRYVSKLPVEFLLSTEDDFTFNQPVDLEPMMAVLREQPRIAQLVLKRQAWNVEEKSAGGIVELHPGDFEERSDLHGNTWTEHRRFWSTNTHLTRLSITELGWPERPESEGHFTARLLDNGPGFVSGADVRFAFWGGKFAPPMVEHIGRERVGHGY